ncbi:Hypothetical protein PHPALM_19642 [Phytophthora palmivora]|uniref:Uncharacterized protein n=1 Tax=Phytophthora palmivora TaxID=4796 RepID=A0A2P4XGW7_9STRA|nr:Hypothetical protein PHPALM_19642 [Phytophthora palmivora]
MPYLDAKLQHLPLAKSRQEILSYATDEGIFLHLVMYLRAAAMHPALSSNDERKHFDAMVHNGLKFSVTKTRLYQTSATWRDKVISADGVKHDPK